MEVVKDAQNRTLGFLLEQGTIIRLNDTQNRTLGTYNSGTDTTVDKNGKAIGRGNQLMRLLPRVY